MVMEGRGGIYMRMAQIVMSKKLTRIDVESLFLLFSFFFFLFFLNIFSEYI